VGCLRSGPGGVGGHLVSPIHRYVGREVTDEEIAFISALCADRATPTREAIARDGGEALGWRAPNGTLETMSAKVAFLAMHRDGLICLPAPRHNNTNGRAVRHLATPSQERLPIAAPRTLEEIGELRLRLVKGRAASTTWNEAVACVIRSITDTDSG